ncbi:DUF1016 N-terminal domain-containing protein [Paraburkholderia tuberum]|uniref:DUF1016 N-terminal domain-containing protein n=1 Tax=Paraburkholderia TaxID=1822464 RepID=UPI0004767702|nr:hypothetical protein [Paraburkholderia sp. WSM4179]
MQLTVIALPRIPTPFGDRRGLVGRRIVKSQQGGQERAAYGQAVLPRVSISLTGLFGRGFDADDLGLMRRFPLAFQPGEISERVIRKSRTRVVTPKSELPIRIFQLEQLADVAAVLDALREANTTDAFV